jgi:NADH:ubiquinone oxidoreductase subunit 5 (subunit L)/multisubunit Na+/H+ antiporter MnhA subunit
MLKTIVFAPLVGALILGLFGRKMSERLIGAIACSSVAVSVIAAFIAFGRLLGAQAAFKSISAICSIRFRA